MLVGSEFVEGFIGISGWVLTVLGFCGCGGEGRLGIMKIGVGGTG